MAHSNPTPQSSPQNLGNPKRYRCGSEGCSKELTSYHKFWECLSKHKICRNCYMIRYEECQSQTPNCPFCSGILQLVKPSLFEELVFIYVDNSNFWIEGKKLAAKHLKLKCVEDPRMRLDIRKVADVVANGRKVASGVLYGSEHSSIDIVWKKMRERGWQVITSQRSTIKNKEKHVDQQLVADIVTLVCDKDIAKGKIAIISGDADVIPAIIEGQGWSYEIWMWNSAISTELKSLAEKKPSLLAISTLDPYLQRISFTNFEFDESHDSSKLYSQFAVIENYDFEPNDDWQKGLTEKLGWPFQVCTRGPKTLLLGFSRVKSKDGEDFTKHFEKIFERLQQEYPGKVVHQKTGSDPEICLTSNKFESLKNVDEGLSTSSICSQNEANEQGQDRGQERQVERPRDSSFQVVESRGKKNYQKSSERCERGSYCEKKLKCEWAHTAAEKKFFRNRGKWKKCRYKNSCRNSFSCRYAHTIEDSYCCKCGQWGHLIGEDKCAPT